MTDRLRLLIVSYYYQPTPSVGSVRVGGLTKYLPGFGWQTTVVTPRREGRVEPNQRVVETDDADLSTGIKRVLGLRPDAALKDAVSGTSSPSTGGGARSRAIDLVKSLVAVPDTNRGWIRIATRAARQALAQQHFDAILTTSPPPSVHLVGSRLARASGLPWVADLRDLWSQDHNSTAPGWRRHLDRALERRTFRSAAALVTVSQPLAGNLRTLHPKAAVHSIINGFDPNELRVNEELAPRFTLTHTGTFYQGRRDPTTLFEAVANLVSDGRIPREQLCIRLFARHEPWVAHLAEAHGISDIVELLPWGSRKLAVKAQHRSHGLLLLHWGGRAERGVYTGKVFEYLAARRPILMIGGGDGVLKDLLEETGAGVYVNDRHGLESTLHGWWRQYQRTGAVAWQGREEVVDRYSHIRMAGEFAEVLNNVCRHR